MERKNMNSNKNRIRRAVCGIMAGVLALSTIGYITMSNSTEVKAKETLDSIRKVVNNITDRNHYRILEVVPDDVSFSVSINDVRDRQHTVSGNQIMGFTGYYIGGQEPVREDISNTFNDTLEEEMDVEGMVYHFTESQLTDSHMRYVFANDMFTKLHEGNILNSGDAREIMTAPRYRHGNEIRYGAYYEIREGEIPSVNLQRRIERGELTELYKDYTGEERLKDEAYKGKDPAPYIDEVRGVMTPSLSGNYLINYDMTGMSEDVEDIAADMIDSYLNDNSSVEKHSLVYTSAFTDGVYDEEKFLSRERGYFDPRLDYVDEETSASVSANTVAVLGRNEDARCGYVVVSNTKADNEHIPAIGTPLYVHVDEGNLSYFVYAGKYGYIDGFTLSANQARRDTDIMTARIEAHPNKIALSAGPGLFTEDELYDNDVDLDAGTGDGENNDADPGDDGDLLTPADGLDGDGDISDPAEPVEPSDPTDPADPTVPTDVQPDYFMLNFAYEANYSSFEVYYTVLDFYSSDQGDAEYYINPDKPKLVNSSMGRGCIGLVENPEQSDLDYFVFDYVKSYGTHLFAHTPYTDDAYEDASVYRIRGAKIYYGFDLTNNDWFKKYALDREAQECAGLPIEVETIRISDLTEDDILAYNMIIVLSGDSTLCLGDEYADYAKTDNDFDTDVYAKIIERVSVDKIPVIGDYGIIQNGNTAIPGSWVSDFVQVLMLKPSNASRTESGFSIYYDAIKMLDLHVNRFDVRDTTGATLYTDNDDHFVNQNAYVFNMKKGQDYLSLLNRYFYSMAPLNRNTIEGFGQEEVNKGFKEVLDDINSENNYRMVDVSEGKDPVLLDTYITEATAIRYIIGFSNKREKNIKGTLRILEIEPSCSFDLYIKDNSYPEQRSNCNSYGMAGNSYSTMSGYSSGQTIDNNNKILYRNGTYKEITDSSKNLQSEGIVYKRSDDTWKDTSVKLDADHSFIKIDGINIELTRMSIAEFIGHVEDLNADYDVIYFGMNIQMLNTQDNAPNNNYVQKRDGKNTTTRYNDSSMDGLVYTNIGDKKKVQPVLISDESHMFSENEAGQDSNAERYSGNDLDNECVKRLTQFVDAGYPIILADKFYKNASAEKESREVNTNQVDSASYMHQFINNIIKKKTVYSVTDVKNDKSDKDGFFVWLLNLAKPEIVIKPETPAAESMKELSPDSQELSSENFEMYGYELTPDNFDGMFHLPFEFSIKNIGAASSNSRYTTELFVDLNADGKYSPREKMDFSAVRENGFTVNEDGTGMRVGYDYYAECKLANTYDGVIPWRLITYQEGHPERRTNATGYFTLRKDKPLHIKILQLNTRKNRNVIGGSTPATSWNMEKTAYKNGKYRQNDNEDIDKTIPYVNRLNIGHDFGDLLNKISPYYELEIRTIESDEWEKEVAKDIDGDNPPNVNDVSVNQYYEDLRRYDMIIVGFADCCQGPVSENANEAIEKFISSERSVLFTHDTTSYINYDYNVSGRISGNQPTWYWGYYFNKHVRNIAGMDRYAIMAGAQPDDIHPYSIAYVPKSGTRTGPAGNSNMSPEAQVLYTRGITNGEMNQRTGSNTYTNIRGIVTNNGQDGGGSTAGNNDARGNTVTQVNDGQITKFPFALHKSFTVTPTHFQYYQLDLTDDEDKDGEKDICVWYCISDVPNRSFSQGGGGDMYEMTPNDVLNNYYIYNKGNVVYTGVGHRSVCDDNGDAFMRNRGLVKKGDYNLGEKPDAGMVNNIDEMKLFINTMVAAYQRGIREPNLKVVRSFTDSSATGSVYVSFDQSIPGITGGSESAVLDDDVSIFFNASRSNFVTSDERIKNDLRIKLFYEATEEEFNAGEAVQLDQFSREYDIPNWDPVNPVELDEAEKHYYQNEDDSETGIYGIPAEISKAEYYAGGSKITRGYKLDEPLLGALPSDGLSVDYGEYLVDDRIYKLTVGGVKSIKSNRTDGSDGDDLWYEYEAGVSSNSIRGRSLNNRRIILVLTNDTYNVGTDVGREESTIKYVTLTRAKMFTLY